MGFVDRPRGSRGLDGFLWLAGLPVLMDLFGLIFYRIRVNLGSECFFFWSELLL